MRKSLLMPIFLLLYMMMGCGGTPSSGISPDSEKAVPELVSEEAEILGRGTFEAAERSIEGEVKLVSSGNGASVVFGDDFSSAKGPDLQVVLHRSSDLLPQLNPPTYPLNEGDYVILGGLKSLRGQQMFPIASDVNLDEYGSVAIWCRKFNATFGTANLAKPKS